MDRLVLLDGNLTGQGSDLWWHQESKCLRTSTSSATPRELMMCRLEKWGSDLALIVMAMAMVMVMVGEVGVRFGPDGGDGDGDGDVDGDGDGWRSGSLIRP